MQLNVRVSLKGRSIGTHSVTHDSVIGRDPECDIHIENLGVSRRHAAFEFDEDGVWLVDLGSSNATLLRGERVTRARIEDGDEVQIGRLTLAMEVRDTPAAGKRAEGSPRNPIKTFRTGDDDGVDDDRGGYAGPAPAKRRGSFAAVAIVIGAIVGAVAVVALVG
jgi:pSer/pThr/pTyr-binding forkhead associated (FHA) protein